ncbi:MAG TPA: GNAT family N-acetyltransferase [Acidimicrobiia bacterium]|nr:GNAT family N-acetyltransferase [Acidimicrobiia bacterium]
MAVSNPKSFHWRVTVTISVCKATTRDIPELSETLAGAFFTDPLFSWWIPEDHRRKEILPELFRVISEARLAGDEVYRSADGVAAAVWTPPGALPTEEETAELAPLLAEATGEYAGTLFEMLGLMDEKHPKEPHFYLFLLGTRPGWQSQGIGSALLRAVLDGCDETGMPAYLEASSEGNKRLYLRHGFEVTDELHLRDSPTAWCMWRPPRP